MELSEEEQRILLKLKEIKYNVEGKLYNFEATIILNLIEKQQKEIERFNNELDLDYVDKNFIPKDKIREKMQAAFAKSGKIPISKPQQQIYEMLLNEYETVEINYPVSNLSLDCFIEIDGVKIDVEYDGWFWHKDKQRDFARDKALLKLGYKTLRIKGGHNIPTIEQLKEKIEILTHTERYFEQIFLDEYLKEEKKKE